MKRGIIFLLFVFALAPLVFAQGTQDHNSFDSLQEEFDESDLLLDSPGLTPDSPFYFLDEFFDRFGDELEVKEEKIAEIKAMIEQGDVVSARKALASYKEYAEELKESIEPEKRVDARKQAARIQKALAEIEDKLAEEDKQAFVEDILVDEEAIVTAVEVAGKIKELCVQLAKLDPVQYHEVCKSNEDDASWKQDLDKQLTKEQQVEAEEFKTIMMQCFRSSGKNCRCEDISFTAMAKMCTKARPLAVACELEGDEAACEELSSLELPKLPPYLESVLEELEGAGDHEEEFNYQHAPSECRDELKEAGVTGDEAHELCEKVIYEKTAPPECQEAGIDNHEDCGTFLFKEFAPPECIEAGLTGEHEDDNKKCDELLEELYETYDDESRNEFHAQPATHCLEIKSDKERLRCFEEAAGKTHHQEVHDFEKECHHACQEEGLVAEFNGEECTCFDPREEYEKTEYENEDDEKTKKDDTDEKRDDDNEKQDDGRDDDSDKGDKQE